jgi:hypothetical protein
VEWSVGLVCGVSSGVGWLIGLIRACWSKSTASSSVASSGTSYLCIDAFGCASVATSFGNNTWCQTPSYSHTIIVLLFSSRSSLSQNIWRGVRSWLSGSLAGRIRILVLRRPFSRSSFDGCTNFLVALPLPLLLSLRLLAVFDKKVESNVTAAPDETLRLCVKERRAKSLAT